MARNHKKCQRTIRRKPRAIDLFSGCGGLTEGLKLAGFRVIGAVEKDGLAVETYEVNHPEVRVWHKDICRLPVSKVMLELGLAEGSLDLLAGCPPCQGFSTIRTLNSQKEAPDARNDLILDFCRFVKRLKPKAVMMENVPGLARNERIKRFCNQLTRLGYNWEIRILDAADYGVAQRRRRMILLASKIGAITFAEPSSTRKTVRDAIGSLPEPGENGDELHRSDERRSPRVVKIISLIPKNGGSRVDLPEEYWLDCHRKCGGFRDVYGRMAWDSVAPTLSGGCINPSKGRFLHPEQNRAITLREAALLQSFRPDYFFSLKKGRYPVAEMIGNALPPEFVRSQAKSVLGRRL